MDDWIHAGYKGWLVQGRPVCSLMPYDTLICFSRSYSTAAFHQTTDQPLSLVQSLTLIQLPFLITLVSSTWLPLRQPFDIGQSALTTHDRHPFIRQTSFRALLYPFIKPARTPALIVHSKQLPKQISWIRHSPFRPVSYPCPSDTFKRYKGPLPSKTKTEP